MIFNKAVVVTMIMLAAATSVYKVAVSGATDRCRVKSGKNGRPLLLPPPGPKKSPKNLFFQNNLTICQRNRLYSVPNKIIYTLFPIYDSYHSWKFNVFF